MKKIIGMILITMVALGTFSASAAYACNCAPCNCEAGACECAMCGLDK